jgi:hypothetical protein
MSWLFTRKRTNTRTPQEIANQRALSEVQYKYGRMGRHSKVANVLFPNEGYHDPFEIERKQLSKKFLEEAQLTAQSITTSEREGVINWANELKHKFQGSISGGGGNSGSINMDIPLYIIKVLLFIIGLGLLSGVVFAVFVDLAVAIASGEVPGLSFFMLNNSLSLMNISWATHHTPRREEPVITVNPLKKPQSTPYRSSRRNRRA